MGAEFFRFLGAEFFRFCYFLGVSFFAYIGKPKGKPKPLSFFA